MNTNLTEISNDIESMFDTSTREGQIRLYNTIKNCNEKLSNHINEIIHVKMFTFTNCKVRNRENNEIIDTTRVIIIDKDNKTYHSVAKGVISSMYDIAEFFGNVFDEPLKIKINQIEVEKGKTIVCEVVE